MDNRVLLSRTDFEEIVRRGGVENLVDWKWGETGIDRGIPAMLAQERFAIAEQIHKQLSQLSAVIGTQAFLLSKPTPMMDCSSLVAELQSTAEMLKQEVQTLMNELRGVSVQQHGWWKALQSWIESTRPKGWKIQAFGDCPDRHGASSKIDTELYWIIRRFLEEVFWREPESCATINVKVVPGILTCQLEVTRSPTQPSTPIVAEATSPTQGYLEQILSLGGRIQWDLPKDSQSMSLMIEFDQGNG